MTDAFVAGLVVGVFSALFGSAPTEAAARQTADVASAHRGRITVETRGRS